MREQGYLVTIKLFLPVDPKNVDDTVAVAMAVQGLQRRDLTHLEPDDIVDVSHRYTSRELTSAEVAAKGTTDADH